MKIKFTCHIKQHAGDILLECQDSFNYNLEKLSFAVSDGVSQAYRPELWSRVLTEAYVNNPDTFFIQDSNNNFVINSKLGLNSKWAAAESLAYNNATPQEQFVLDMKRNSINISAATFIGVKLIEEGISFQTIGDSVLFFYDYETRELKAYSSMMSESGEMTFNNNPEYIDSNESNHGKVISGILPYRKGILFMATDALSDWIVERHEPLNNIEKILKELMLIPTHEAYDLWVDCARNNSNPTKLKDDDTTFIAIEFTDITDNSKEIEHNFTVKFDALLKDCLLSELNSQRNELEEIKSAKSKSEMALRGKEKQISGLTTDLESSKNEIATKNTEIVKLRTEIQSLNNQINKLKIDLNNSDAKCRRLENTKSSLTTDKNRLTQELQKSNQDVLRLQNENKRLEEVIKSHKTTPLSTMSTPKEDEITKLQSDLNTANARMQMLQSKLETLQEIAKNARSSYDTNGEITILDIETLLTSILGESFATGKVYVEQTIIVGKTTGDGGFQM